MQHRHFLKVSEPDAPEREGEDEKTRKRNVYADGGMLLIVVASLNILFCPPSYLDFLPVHMCHHPEDALGLGIPEGFIHLPVSPHHSLHLLRDRHLHILPAQLQSFHPLRKNGVRVLYGSHPRAESCGLQPKKQSQECFQESY